MHRKSLLDNLCLSSESLIRRLPQQPLWHAFSKDEPKHTEITTIVCIQLLDSKRTIFRAFSDARVAKADENASGHLADSYPSGRSTACNNHATSRRARVADGIRHVGSMAFIFRYGCNDRSYRYESSCMRHSFSSDAVSPELSVLSAIVIMYLSIRSIKTNENPANKHTGDLQMASNSEGSSMNGGSMKDGSTSADFLGVNPPSARNRRQPDINNIGRSSPLPGTVAARHDHGVARPITIIDTEDASIGSRGLVWATSDRDYRQVPLTRSSRCTDADFLCV